jgi:hypothetical protein
MRNHNQDRIRQGSYGVTIGRMAADPVLITGRGTDRPAHAIANIIMNVSRSQADGTSIMTHSPMTVSLFGPDALDFVEGSSTRTSVVCGDLVAFNHRLDLDPRYHERSTSHDVTAQGRKRTHIKFKKPVLTIKGKETTSFNLVAIVSEGWELLRPAFDSVNDDDDAPAPFVPPTVLSTPARVVATSGEAPTATLGAIMGNLGKAKKSSKN